MKCIKGSILVIAAALIFSGCDASKADKSEIISNESISASSSQIQQSFEEVPTDGYPVETPCGILYYPSEWAEELTVDTIQGESVVVSFLAGETKLFDLSFGKSAENALGFFETEDEMIYVGMTIYPLSDDNDHLLSMQETVNTLLDQLKLKRLAEIPSASDSKEDMVFETVYGKMNFPGKWKEYMQTKQPEDDVLEFYCSLPGREPVLLFTAAFGVDEGGLTAVIKGKKGGQTPVTFALSELLFDDSWAEREKDLLYAMQEDLNYLLDNLK